MKLPIGKISGSHLDKIFEDSIKYHLDSFFSNISEYYPTLLYSHWRSTVRSIDEMINIPMELNTAEEVEQFLQLKTNFFNHKNLPPLKKVLELLEKKFQKNVAIRFQQLAMMCSAVNQTYTSHNIYIHQGNSLNLSDIENCISYLQSRRAYYVTTLNLIPKIAKGKKAVEYINTFGFLQHLIDSCLVNITTAYYNLLLNHCLPDFEMKSDGIVAKRNFEYNHLEGFFFEPERLSLIDQLELRPEVIVLQTLLPKAANKIFSFSEVENTLTLLGGAFNKYNVMHNDVFKEINHLLKDIKIHLKDDFHVIIEENEFKRIVSKYSALTLYINSNDYFDNLNSYAPFQLVEKNYYTTVVLLIRFVYRTISQSLLKNRTFQIHSGFIFEDKVSKILELKGFLPTGITRINHKEFDLITTRDNKVYNFQCKNNFIDISRVNYDYKKIGRLNMRLCRYYESALKKEIGRESLIKTKTGINEIEHFVVTRFPVITRNRRIINFVDLEKWNLK
ncbi:hypothetical protein C8N40_110158 [Pontibacter mucosus]|uniref:Restriction endonuclease n=1 Tax=Pontibacter mucosus TaxID=1649266 RepID=A0A2T5YDV7_9BACT|nr:hypothetical protein [Pontibacter mucosus]PTX14729.1 hypothetical protein C8N40_110158 [Pontibacter mucosus]